MRVPIVIQMHSGENGAAALAMILFYYKKYLPMEQIRSKCLYTRNGSTPEQLCEAANFFGMESKVKRIKQEEWKNLSLPCIAQWTKKYFVVVTGFDKGRVKLNDPFKGAVSIKDDEFFQGCTGKIVELKPGADFVQEGKADGLWGRIRTRLSYIRKLCYILNQWDISSDYVYGRQSMQEMLERVLEPKGIMYETIKLEADTWKSNTNVMLGFL